MVLHHLLLPHTEFAYNKAPSKIIRISPCKVVHGNDPLVPLNLVPIPLGQRPSVDADQRVEEIKRPHECARERIKRANSTYSPQANKHRKKKVFQPGDVV